MTIEAIAKCVAELRQVFLLLHVPTCWEQGIKFASYHRTAKYMRVCSALHVFAIVYFKLSQHQHAISHFCKCPVNVCIGLRFLRSNFEEGTLNRYSACIKLICLLSPFYTPICLLKRAAFPWLFRQQNSIAKNMAAYKQLSLTVKRPLNIPTLEIN